MNVRDAIALMARNPAVDFPWEGTLVSLLNGFLPQDGQLDPHTAESKEIQTAIDSLDSNLQEMVYGSNLGSANIVTSIPSPATAAVNLHQILFAALGITIVALAILLAARSGPGTDNSVIVEILKVGVDLLRGGDGSGSSSGGS